MGKEMALRVPVPCVSVGGWGFPRVHRGQWEASQSRKGPCGPSGVPALTFPGSPLWRPRPSPHVLTGIGLPSLPGVSTATRQCLRPGSWVKETHCEGGQQKVRGPDL